MTAPREGKKVESVRAAGSPAAAHDLIRTLSIKGSATVEAIAAALMSTPEQVRPALDRLVRSGLAERKADTAKLTGRGQLRARALTKADQAAWGIRNAAAALKAFRALDTRAKETITAWQIKEVGGTQVLNDHADSLYDGRVLRELRALHGDATQWLSSLSPKLSQFHRYHARLDRAVKGANDGDGRFWASPLVDSYHTVWFELHEELIRLAGHRRTD